jgi:neural Wiskott-Aldrich syndrome protein
MSDPNEKHPRTFQCRDVVWESLEQMARDLECSVDYLINEALKQYMRQRGMRTLAGGGGRTREEPPAPPSPAVPPPPPPFAAGASAPRGGSPLPVGPPPLPLAPPGMAQPRSPSMAAFRENSGPSNPNVTPQALPPYGAPHHSPPPPPQWNARPLPPPDRGQMPGPPPPMSPPQRGAPPLAPPPPYSPPSAPAMAAAPAALPSLSVVYGGQRHPVNKDRFIIGRGQKAADLTIKDPNISRQHAMVEFVGNQYFIVDMGSTNGIEYNGQRIARKPIAEGDVVRICDHEVRFTYRRDG